ncbi:MAG: response regulator transcription factor [Anaerolineales bacterium]|nr:response regulator transcription factor [Anaerolineales bacterium]
MSTPIRIVVVDDHILFRQGLVGLLSEMDGFEAVGQAGNGKEALIVIKEQKPDVVLLDVNMPEVDGLGALKLINEAGIEVKVLMLTISEKEQDLVAAIAGGADGYLLKNTEPDALCKTINDVIEGNSVLSPEITTQVFQLLRRDSVSPSNSLLSEREIEVLKCLAHGQTTSQTADELFISDNTVKTHIRHIMKKMGVGNRAEAVAMATREGWLR